MSFACSLVRLSCGRLERRKPLMHPRACGGRGNPATVNGHHVPLGSSGLFFGAPAFSGAPAKCSTVAQSSPTVLGL